MASPIPQQVIDQIKNTDGVLDSATLLITTFAAREQAAIDAALANGATAAQLEPITSELANVKAKTDALAAAVAATP